MKLTVILTSYNRSRLVQKAVRSVLAQTDPNWRLIIQDDGSGMSTLGPLGSLADADHRITLREHPNVKNRLQVTRYAVLINEALPLVRSELVAYMCDNVEFNPAYVATVRDYFNQHPDTFAGYVYHERDMVNFMSGKRLGKASDFGHWDFTPPGTTFGAITAPRGLLDHSQVIHRLPTAVRWEEDISALKCGDGVFFERLIAAHGPIHPIAPGVVLSKEHLIK